MLRKKGEWSGVARVYFFRVHSFLVVFWGKVLVMVFRVWCESSDGGDGNLEVDV